MICLGCFLHHLAVSMNFVWGRENIQKNQYQALCVTQGVIEQLGTCIITWGVLFFLIEL